MSEVIYSPSAYNGLTRKAVFATVGRQMNEIPKVIEVTALEPYSVTIKYADGVGGEVGFSHLAGKGVFRKWEEPGVFERVRIGQGNTLAWSEDIEICAEAIYLRITGKKIEDYARQSASVHEDT